MSAPRCAPIELAPRAKQDLGDLLRSAADTWGEPQMRAYGAKIDDALHAIARDPQLGYRRADLPWTYLAYLVGSHIIIYRIGETTIGVLRILPEGLSRPQHN